MPIAVLTSFPISIMKDFQLRVGSARRVVIVMEIVLMVIPPPRTLATNSPNPSRVMILPVLLKNPSLLHFLKVN